MCSDSTVAEPKATPRYQFVQELVDAEEESENIDAVAEDVQSPQEHPEAEAKDFHYVSDADDQEFQRQEERRYSQRE
jgi:hypothetical protein